MKKIGQKLTALLGLSLLLYGCSTFSTPKKLVVLDSGHNPEQGGAVSLTGIDEVEYNDRFVSELQTALRQSGIEVVLTRTPNETLSLQERAKRANGLRASLFLSIHHDSAQLHYLYPIKIKGKSAYRTVQVVQGSSILVSTENPKFAQSYHFAEILGEELARIPRQAAWHHNGNMIGQNHPLLNPKYGIYQYDKLVVLRKTTVPAVLFEVGVIVDKTDEAFVTNPLHRRLIINAIVRAVHRYLSE